MSNGYFQFKQFRIAQDRCAMKVGTDGVLLGAWASIGAAAPPPLAADAALRQPSDAAVQALPPLYILDIGTGTGLVALMLAQRAASREWGSRAFSVTAVEREAAAASQARENAAASPWAAMVTVVTADARHWQPAVAPAEPTAVALASTAAPLVSAAAATGQPLSASEPPVAPRFDLIVCNPPFYANYLKSPDAARNAARHDDGLTLDDLCRMASAWLKPAPASLSLILPAGREPDALEAAARHGLCPVRRCHVFTSPSATTPSRVLLSLGRLPAASTAAQSAGMDAQPAVAPAEPASAASAPPVAPLAEKLLLYSPGSPARYSPEYRALVHPFYLNL